METPQIENGEYEHHGRTIGRRQGTQDEPPQRRMRLSIDTVDRCCNCTRQSTCQTNGCDCFRAGRRCENCLCFYQCCNLFLNSPLTIECSDMEDSVGPHRVRDSTNANEENILILENLPTGEENDGEGTPVSPSTQVDALDTPTAAAGDDSTDTTTEEPTEEENSIKDVVGILPGAEITDTDRKMFTVYGDYYVHQNDGTHLDGGVTDDAQWQEYWRKLAILPPQQFDVPTGAVGRQFVEILTEELVGVAQRTTMELREIFRLSNSHTAALQGCTQSGRH
eukprot:scaffold35059_cov31-Attheya_sp.AAC.2